MMLRHATLSALAGLALLIGGIEPMARERTQSRLPEAEAVSTEAALGERMNANTVSVITGTPGGTYFRIGADLAFVLNDGDKLRVLPILGKGAGENAYDIRFLKGVDLGFIRTDTLEQLRQDKRLKDIDQRIQYIAKLFNDELHVIAPKAVGISGTSPASASPSREGQRHGLHWPGDVPGPRRRRTGRQRGPADGPGDVAQREVDAVVSVAAKPVSVIRDSMPATASIS